MTGGSLDRGMSTRNGSKLGSMQPLADVVMRPPEPDNGEVHKRVGRRHAVRHCNAVLKVEGHRRNFANIDLVRKHTEERVVIVRGEFRRTGVPRDRRHSETDGRCGNIDQVHLAITGQTLRLAIRPAELLQTRTHTSLDVRATSMVTIETFQENTPTKQHTLIRTVASSILGTCTA